MYILCLFFPVEFFEPCWGLVRQRLVGSDLIIKPDVLIHTFSEVCLRGIIPAVGFFLFEGGKKGFRHGVIIGTARVRERLFDTTGAEQGHKGFGYVLSAPVTVESQFTRAVTILKGLPECSSHKMGAALS